ncbi:MAG: hypothetical protein KatS3mg086_007 [Candidatus Dojkabacteria bacterium]|nr:MAG: hypothetical protein KatS3mg086_007 [Candidatus Dojkabacteria bacterium]
MRRSRKNTKFKNNSEIYFWGEKYTINFIQTPTLKSFVIKSDKTLKVFRAFDSVQTYSEILENYFRQEAKKIIENRVIYFAELIGEDYNQIYIKDTISRWGSCSSKRNLNFCWRLVLAPREILDYVCAHEVAHLKHMNHSRSFWNLLESIFPSYKDARNWLKTNGKKLHEF